jgi:hypothetical protein
LKKNFRCGKEDEDAICCLEKGRVCPTFHF